MTAFAILLVITVGTVLGVGLVVAARAAAGAALRPAPPAARPPALVPPRLAPGGRWRAAHRADDADGATLVVVERVVRPAPREPEVVAESRVVARVLPDDPRWEETFTAAMGLARERAALLEAQGDL